MIQHKPFCPANPDYMKTIANLNVGGNMDLGDGKCTCMAEKIIVADNDGGFILAKLVDGLVYEYVEYYHQLKDALEEI